MLKGFFSAIAISLLTACSTTTTVDSTKTPLNIADREDAMAYWISAKIVKPQFPVTAAIRQQAGCARFEVTIDEGGAPTDIVFLESFPANQFIQTSKDALRQWRWKPTQSNAVRHPIRRVVQLDFFTSTASNLEQAKAFCTEYTP